MRRVKYGWSVEGLNWGVKETTASTHYNKKYLE